MLSCQVEKSSPKFHQIFPIRDFKSQMEFQIEFHQKFHKHFCGLGSPNVVLTPIALLTCIHASFLFFAPFAGHPSSSLFLGAFLPISPPREVLLCRARGTAPSLKRGSFRMDRSHSEIAALKADSPPLARPGALVKTILWIEDLEKQGLKKSSNSKNHPKPSQEFSEQIGPSIHKIKGFLRIHTKCFHPQEK